MDKIYIVEGWFGDQEWIEKVFADKAMAELYCAKLWETRESKLDPMPVEYAKGLHKFDVVEHEVY